MGTAQRGEGWFTALYVRCAPAIRAYAVRRVPDEADDVVSEVFGSAWRLRDELPGDDHAALLWLYATARHTVLHTYRGALRRQRLASRAGSTSTEGEAPDLAAAVVERLDAQALVRQAIGRLAERDAEVLRLWAWEDLEPVEIAVVLGCRTGTARVRLHRARRRAAALMELTPLVEIFEPMAVPTEECHS